MYRHRVISERQEAMAKHPTIFPPETQEFSAGQNRNPHLTINPHLTLGDMSLEPDTGERFAALGWVDPAFNDLRALSERPADLLPIAVMRAEAESDPDVVSGTKLNESNLHVAIAIADGDFAHWLCHQDDGDDNQELIQKRANALVLPASPTLAELQDAVAGALDRDLLPDEVFDACIDVLLDNVSD